MKQLEEYSVEALQSGLAHDAQAGRYTCLVCGAQFEKGEVFPVEGRFFSWERAAQLHAQTAHGSRFEQLLQSDSRYLTLTDHQKDLMQMLYDGLSDAQIAQKTGATTATVRRQRFMFREKAKQARMYLALYGCVQQQREAEEQPILPTEKGANMLAKYEINQMEYDKILKNAFDSLSPLRLNHLPQKEKKRVAIINRISEVFSEGNDYTEKQINGMLKEIYPDYVTLRRYLIEYGYLNRTPSGSRYWVQ